METSILSVIQDGRKRARDACLESSDATSEARFLLAKAPTCVPEALSVPDQASSEAFQAWNEAKRLQNGSLGSSNETNEARSVADEAPDGPPDASSVPDEA